MYFLISIGTFSESFVWFGEFITTDDKLIDDFLEENTKYTQLKYWMKSYLDKFYTKKK